MAEDREAHVFLMACSIAKWLPRRIELQVTRSLAFQLYPWVGDWARYFRCPKGTPTAFLLQVGPFGLTRSPLGLEDC